MQFTLTQVSGILVILRWSAVLVLTIATTSHAQSTATLRGTIKDPNGAVLADAAITATNNPMFDARQLQRWHISEGLLPPGSDVRFREPSFWEQYKWRIIAAVTLVAVQTLLIVVLLVQRSKRSRAEKSRRISEENLHKLSGRLIHLQFGIILNRNFSLPAYRAAG